MSKTLILASKNVGKVKEFKEILEPLGFDIVSMKDAGINIEIDETGTTFEENSRIKAEAVMKIAGLPVIADDSGICCDALGGGPGVYSARYGGEGLTDQDRTQELLKSMRGAGSRKCQFVAVITCCMPDGTYITARGVCEGTVSYAPIGTDGFGYDPIFFVPEYKKTFAQMTAEEKNAVSHRGKALKEFYKKMENYINGINE